MLLQQRYKCIGSKNYWIFSYESVEIHKCSAYNLMLGSLKPVLDCLTAVENAAVTSAGKTRIREVDIMN